MPLAEAAFSYVSLILTVIAPVNLTSVASLAQSAELVREKEKVYGKEGFLMKDSEGRGTLC